MDDLLQEFLVETNENLDTVNVELVRFEQEPNNAQILGNIFRLIHTIKGTCGFLNLPRLEALTHAAEALMDKFRNGMPVTGAAVSLVLATIDRIKDLLEDLERHQCEPAGDDNDLIVRLREMMAGHSDAPAPDVDSGITAGTLVYQVLERPLRPGEVSLDELERSFREAPGPDDKHYHSDHPADPEFIKDPLAEEMPADRRLTSQSIRVQLETLENLMTMVSELVLTRNQLLEISRRHEDSEFKAPLQQLSNVTAELQDSIMKTRMQPIGNAWQKLPRIVRDLSSELGKSIELEMHGGDTELDRQMLDFIKDPLLHMVRNSADHGLELPQERRAAGKPEKGTIRLSAHHEGGQIVIQLADDGRGLDTARIGAKALARKLCSEDDIAKMSDAQIQKFIFVAGFSTAAGVTNVSGRGVGMDVVHANIDQIGGAIDIKSVAQRGTVITIKIPLTLAIMPVLIVEAGGDRFAIPQSAVAELVRVRTSAEHRIERIKGATVLRLRNKLLPLVCLKTMLKMGQPPASPIEDGFVVVLRVGGETFGVVTDGVLHTEEIVVKPMSRKLRHLALFSGTTILGDGVVLLILDPNGIARMIGASLDVHGTAPDEPPAAGDPPEHNVESLLLFRAGSPLPRAIPISLVTRLEQVDVRRIEAADGRLFVQYRGQLMPVIPVNDGVTLRHDGVQPLLVFADGDRAMGLIVDEIIDIVEGALSVEVPGTVAGSLGSAIIKGQATDILDLAHFLPLAFADWFDWKERPRAAASRRVLLIDDAPFFRNMLAPVLSAAGYHVAVVASAVEALELLRSGHAFEAIVTDIEMPGMNGFELAEALRNDARHGETPVIGLSATVSPAAVERGRRAGLYDYVAKFDRPGLIAALKEQTAPSGQAA